MRLCRHLLNVRTQATKIAMTRYFVKGLEQYHLHSSFCNIISAVAVSASAGFLDHGVRHNHNSSGRTVLRLFIRFTAQAVILESYFV